MTLPQFRSRCKGRGRTTAVGCQLLIRAGANESLDTDKGRISCACLQSWHLASHGSKERGKTVCLVRVAPPTGELPQGRSFHWENLHKISTKLVSLLMMHSLHHCKSRGRKDELSNRSRMHGTPWTGGIWCHPQANVFMLRGTGKNHNNSFALKPPFLSFPFLSRHQDFRMMSATWETLRTAWITHSRNLSWRGGLSFQNQWGFLKDDL